MRLKQSAHGILKSIIIFFFKWNNSNVKMNYSNWIIHYCRSHGLARLKKNIILQYGPVRLRNKTALEPLLNNLAYTQKIILKRGEERLT